MRVPVDRFLQRGFSLIELIIFIVVVGVATGGLFAAINSSTVNNVNPHLQIRALELAQAQMDEIIGKRYDENSPNGGIEPCNTPSFTSCTAEGAYGPETGETTDPVSSLLFDDVDDYHGYSAVPAGYGGYSMAVTVTNQNLDGRPTKLITVTVTPGGGEPVRLSAFRGNF